MFKMTIFILFKYFLSSVKEAVLYRTIKNHLTLKGGHHEC